MYTILLPYYCTITVWAMSGPGAVGVVRVSKEGRGRVSKSYFACGHHGQK